MDRRELLRIRELVQQPLPEMQRVRKRVEKLTKKGRHSSLSPVVAAPNASCFLIWEELSNSEESQTWLMEVIDHPNGQLRCRSKLTFMGGRIHNGKPPLTWNFDCTMIAVFGGKCVSFVSLARSEDLKDESLRHCLTDIPVTPVVGSFSDDSFIYRHCGRRGDETGIFECRIQVIESKDSVTGGRTLSGIEGYSKRKIHSSCASTTKVFAPLTMKISLKQMRDKMIAVSTTKQIWLINLRTKKIKGKMEAIEGDGFNIVDVRFSPFGRQLILYYSGPGFSCLDLYRIRDIQSKQVTLIPFRREFLNSISLGPFHTKSDFWSEDIVVFYEQMKDPFKGDPETIVGFYSIDQDCCYDHSLVIPSGNIWYDYFRVFQSRNIVVRSTNHIGYDGVWMTKWVDFEQLQIILERWMRQMSIDQFVWDLLDCLYSYI